MRKTCKDETLRRIGRKEKRKREREGKREGSLEEVEKESLKFKEWMYNPKQ